VANHHVIDHVLIRRAGFVVHGPAGIEELKLTSDNKVSHLLFHIFALFIEPHGEELHLNVGKLLSWVPQQLIDDIFNDEFNTSILCIFVSTAEVLIWSLKPTNIIVGVGDQMNRKWEYIT
jgi:hypothetical protein